MKKLCILCILPLVCAGALHVRDKAYIETEINGETIAQRMELEELYEYNPGGKEVYHKDSGGVEYRYEYGRHGNATRSIRKDKDGKTAVSVWIREYYPNSSVVKKEARYIYAVKRHSARSRRNGSAVDTAVQHEYKRYRRIKWGKRHL